jgi:hypothetical protein
VGEMYELSRRQLEMMREESRMRDAIAGRPQPREFPPAPRNTGDPQFDWAWECTLAGRPVTLLTPEEIAARMPRPVEFTPPAGAKPLAVAMGLLNHELATNAAPVAVLIAKAAKLGVSESTLRRAKKTCNVKTIERDDGYWWELGIRLEG